MCCYLPQAAAGPPHAHRLGSDQYSTPLLPGRGEIFPLLIRPPVLIRRGTICPQTALDCMVPYRAGDMACSPGGVVVSLGGIRGQPGLVQVGSSQRFCVHKFWWVQDIQDAYRTCSAVR
jgi:hypothetical protein